MFIEIYQTVYTYYCQARAQLINFIVQVFIFTKFMKILGIFSKKSSILYPHIPYIYEIML